GRSGTTRDKTDYRFGHRLDILGRFLLIRTTDLTDHDDGTGIRVGFKTLKHVDKACPDDRVTPDADARRLADSSLSQLVDHFVGKRAAARHDSDRTGFKDDSRQDTDEGLTRRDEPRAVGPDQYGALRTRVSGHGHHFMDRDPFGNADDEFDAVVDGF